MSIFSVKLVATSTVERVSSTRKVKNAASPPEIRAFGDFLRHRLPRSRSTSRCFLCRLLLFLARFGRRFFLRAGLLQALLQNRYQIDHLCRLRRFPWFLFDFFPASFHFFLDHMHECLAIIVLVFFGLPFRRHAADK